MEDVAERAGVGVGVGTVYRRYASTDALLVAIADQFTRELDQAASAG